MRVDILGIGFDNVTFDEAVDRGFELLCSDFPSYVVTPNSEIVYDSLSTAIMPAFLTKPVLSCRTVLA